MTIGSDNRLIDGHALAYRTYFALTGAGGDSRWLTSAGEPTAGVFGFTSVLLRILEQERPDYLAVAFDTGKTFRDEMYPEYKATREKMPDDLRTQIERIRELVENESKSSPLSDDKIARILQSEGIQIARRTVAKYRDQMKILKAQFRKRHSKQTAGSE